MRTAPFGSIATRVPFGPASTVRIAEPAAVPKPAGAIATSSAPPGPGYVAIVLTCPFAGIAYTVPPAGVSAPERPVAATSA